MGSELSKERGDRSTIVCEVARGSTSDCERIRERARERESEAREGEIFIKQKYYLQS